MTRITSNTEVTPDTPCVTCGHEASYHRTEAKSLIDSSFDFTYNQCMVVGCLCEEFEPEK